MIEQFKDMIHEVAMELRAVPRFHETDSYVQHGDTTVYDHSYKVALMSCKIADYFGFEVDYIKLIKGALLHDYFLYDWHDVKNGRWIHGFVHPRIALNNAKEDFEISEIEENIILRHMFPLVPIPPNCVESWIVCIADKLSASAEFSESYGNVLYTRFMRYASLLSMRV